MALLYILPTAILHMVGLGNHYTTFLLLDGMLPLQSSREPRCGTRLRRGGGEGHRISLSSINYDSNGTSPYDAEGSGTLEIGGLRLGAVGDSYEGGMETAGRYEQWVGRVGGLFADEGGMGRDNGAGRADSCECGRSGGTEEAC